MAYRGEGVGLRAVIRSEQQCSSKSRSSDGEVPHQSILAGIHLRPLSLQSIDRSASSVSSTALILLRPNPLGFHLRAVIGWV
jgi:hypothetical protein